MEIFNTLTRVPVSMKVCSYGIYVPFESWYALHIKVTRVNIRAESLAINTQVKAVS